MENTDMSKIELNEMYPDLNKQHEVSTHPKLGTVTQWKKMF